MVLRFDVDACMKALLEKIIQLADALIDEMYADSTQGMKDPEKKSIDKEYAQYAEGVIKAQIVYGALAIMRSYGTGSAMDTTNPYLQDYMSSHWWNPVRKTTEIVGRPAGEYINILGQKAVSSGRMEGRSLEEKFPPIQPTNGISRMEQRYIRNQYTKVDSEFQRVVKEFLENEMHKFFYNTGG